MDKGIHTKVQRFMKYTPNIDLRTITKFIISTAESVTHISFDGKKALQLRDFHYNLISHYQQMDLEEIHQLSFRKQESLFHVAFEIHKDVTGTDYAFYEIAALLEHQLLKLYSPVPKHLSVPEYKTRLITSIIVHHVKRLTGENSNYQTMRAAVQWKHGTDAKKNPKVTINKAFDKQSLLCFRFGELLSLPLEMLQLYFDGFQPSEVTKLLKHFTHDTSKKDSLLLSQTLDIMHYMLKEDLLEKNTQDEMLNAVSLALVRFKKNPDDPSIAFKHLLKSPIIKRIYKQNIPWYRRITLSNRISNIRQLMVAVACNQLIFAQPHHISSLGIDWNPYFKKIYRPYFSKYYKNTIERNALPVYNDHMEPLSSSEPKQPEKSKFEITQHKLESLKKLITSYQMEFLKAINYPAFNDITLPEVTAMQKQLSVTENLMNKADYSQNHTDLHAFKEAVGILEIDIQVAQRRAEELSQNGYSLEEQKDFTLAENLFLQAKSEGNTIEARQNFYRKLQEVIQRLNRSTEVIPVQITKEIEKTAQRELTQ